jgi:hypothetical protein
MAEFIHNIKKEFDLPGGLNIYLLRQPDVSEEALRRVGSPFGLHTVPQSGTLVHNARGITFSMPSGWGLKLLRASAGWRYRHTTRWQADDGNSHLTIDDEPVFRLAQEVLAKFKLPSGAELHRSRVERLYVAHSQREGKGHQERIVGVRALFRRVLDGLSVYGVGGTTIVYLDHARELTGVDHLWRAIESVHEPVKKLRPIAEAIEEVRQRYRTGAGRVEVIDLHLGYFELGWDNEQEYLQPAYVFTLQISTEDPPFRMKATVPVVAAANAIGTIEPRVPLKQQPARHAG